MGNPKKTRSPAPNLERRRFLRRLGLQLAALLCAAVGAAVGFHLLRQYVKQQATFTSQVPHVVLVNRPVWMSDQVADQIISTAKPAAAHSVFDQQLLVDVTDLLRGNPWVRQVKQVRRTYQSGPGDTLEVDCDYRAPIALVHWKDYYWLVDGQGTALPEQYTAQQLHQTMYGADGQMNIRIIDGVSHVPPGTARHWPGDDLAAGLDLVKLLYGKPYAQEAYKVDVTNFDGRVDPREAQLVLWTVEETQVRWGRPIGAKDYFIEVSPAQKLEHMQQLVEKYHRLDANHPWVDIRFDQVTSPKEETATVR